MNSRKSLVIVLCTAFVVAALQVTTLGQTANQEANLRSEGTNVRWDVRAPYSIATLTVSAPDGRVFTKVFKSSSSPEFALTDKQGERLPDGQYSYELRLTPILSPSLKSTMKAARGKDDDAEEVRATRKSAAPAQPTVQSGGFSILNGSVIVAGAVENTGRQASSQHAEQPQVLSASGLVVTKLRKHHLSPMMVPDQVIPDDLIVQGSACIGLDCVNGEVFGFDTIRMKENNTRIQFDDTSVSPFPTNNWQIRANSSASGGESFLGFVDQGTTGNSETGTIVLQVNAGAPANSVKVASTGKVGLRTATPVLDLHINTSDTPAHRLEQNSSGGFTAQTWDVAGNEANFFVRDVTGGSRLPLRIRPGAPTSSIDISATGSVGMGTANPNFSANSARFLAVDAGSGAFSEIGAGGNQSGITSILGAFSFFNSNLAVAEKRNAVIAGANDGATNSGKLQFFTVNAGTIGERMRINRTGQVGIGTAAPSDTLSVNGTASKPGGGAWAVFSDERLKTIKGRFNSGLRAVMQLQPLRYEYRPSNALGLKAHKEYVGFGAQAVQKIIPEAVTMSENGYLQVNNDPILWTMLNAIKEQQQEIAELRKEIRQLRATSRRRR